MAITIGTKSTSPNLANNNVVYSVSSTKTNEPQFRFVMDINDRSGNLLQRLKQQPNVDYGVGIFDIGQILPNYLGPTDKIWYTATDNTPNTNFYCADEFQIRFGEEYAVSATATPDVFPGTYTGGGSAAPGDPAVSSSYYTYFIDGVKNPNELGNGFNWLSSSKYDQEDTYGTPTFNHQNGLTNFDTSKVRLGDYHTISILNGNLDGLPNAAVDNGYAQDIYAMRIEQFDSDNGTVGLDTLYNLSIRGSSIELWDDVYLLQTYRTRLLHWGVGPQNMVDGGITIDPDCAYYIVTFHNQTAEPGVNDNGIYGTYRFDIKEAACDFPGTRFTWKNEYGVWDYFNFELATATTSDIQRESYQQNFVDYGAISAQAQYDRRGMKQFQNKITRTFTAESNYLTQEEADNVRELFYSTNVYVQNPDGNVADNNTFLPVVIESVSVTEKTNPRSQKLFRYTVQYRYANELQPRV